jgi:hypothetical protein
MVSIQEQINDHFKIPILFTNITRTPINIVTDLELTAIPTTTMTAEFPTTNNIYNILFSSNSILSNSGIPNWINNYTTDITFLKNNRSLIKNFNLYNTSDDTIVYNAYNSFKTIKGSTEFLDRFHYFTWNSLLFLNKYASILLVVSLYSILSPVLNLVTPLTILIIPFIMLKYKKIPITLASYIRIVINKIRNNNFGRLIFSWTGLSWGQRVYFMLMSTMYIYGIYQNIISCYTYYKNSYTITEDISNVTAYLKHTLIKLRSFMDHTKTYVSFKPYSEYLNQKYSTIQSLLYKD